MQRIPVAYELQQYPVKIGWDGRLLEGEEFVNVWFFVFDDRNPDPPRNGLSWPRTLDGSTPLETPAQLHVRWASAMVARGTPETLATRLRHHGLYLVAMAVRRVKLPLERPEFVGVRHMVDSVYADFDAFIEEWELSVGQQTP